MADQTVQDLIRQEASKQGVPPELALAVAQQESSFNPTVRNASSGALGTFQLLPGTAQTLGVDPNDPRQNISGGVKYLRQLMDKHQGDLRKVLAEYGGVKNNTTYVPGVLARIPKFKAQPYTGTDLNAPTNSILTSAGREAIAQRTGQVIKGGVDLGRSILKGFDPRTSGGRQNIAGAAGSAAAAYFAPELELPNLLRKVYQIGVPLVGAAAGGATAAGAEDVAAGGPPKPSSMAAAATSQAGTEAVGQVGSRLLFQPIARRIGASRVAGKISQTLSDAIDAAKGRLTSMQPAVTPSKAGQMVDAVAQGPAKDVRTRLGEDVEAAAASGPPVPAQPLRDRLADLAQQVTPMASHQPAQTALPVSKPGPGASPASQAIAKQQAALLQTLPPDHPLPGALDRIREAIGTEDTIPYSEAHKIKTLLDSVVNWDRAAKKPAEQITKGFRQTLRDAMSGHAPYDQATAAYGPVAKLYTRDVNTLHRDILSNPEGIVAKLDWDKPSAAQMLKNLTVDTAAKAGPAGANQGEAAWSALRAAWTHENLIAKGPAAMNKTIAQMEASGNGQEFIKTMYGDPAGKAQLENLKQIGAAWEAAKSRAAEFSQTNLAQAPPARQVLGDIAAVAMPGHPIYKARAGFRLVFGPHEKEMVEWASHSPATTQFLVKHVLTGPNPGQALADFMRYFQDVTGGDSGAPPAPSTSTVPVQADSGPPPQPRAIR